LCTRAKKLFSSARIDGDTHGAQGQHQRTRRAAPGRGRAGAAHRLPEHAQQRLCGLPARRRLAHHHALCGLGAGAPRPDAARPAQADDVLQGARQGLPPVPQGRSRPQRLHPRGRRGRRRAGAGKRACAFDEPRSAFDQPRSASGLPRGQELCCPAARRCEARAPPA